MNFRQPLLCKLINYFQKGDYATFKKISHLSFNERTTSDKYFDFNLFIASHISGLIEASDNENTWSKSFDEDIKINSLCPKSIGTTNNWFTKNESVPLITDWKNKPLIVGTHDSSQYSYSVYGNDFLNKVPSFVEIEKEILMEESYPKDWGKFYEVFDFQSSKWEKSDANQLNEGFLLKTKKDFSNISYHIVFPNVRLSFRILQPEWVYIIGLYLLNWEAEKVIKISQNSISIVRGFRLPIIFNRFLFASSKLTRLGPHIEYQHLHPSAVNWLAHYISPRKLAYA